MLGRLEEIAQFIRGRQKELGQSAADARQSNRLPACTDEKSLVLPVGKTALNLSVCGIDGGLLYERMHGLDLLMARAVAVNFVYQDSSVKSFTHLPSRFPPHGLEIRSGMDEHEAMLWKNLHRLKNEVSAALDSLDKCSPALVLLDGSILPLPSDRPPKNSVVFPLYSETISLFTKLYSACDRQGVQLAGVAKDSRAKRLCDSMEGAPDIPDTMFVGHLLKGGERTCAMTYSDNQDQPVLSDLKDYAGRFRLFYLRPSEHDLPLRVEYLSSGKSAGEIASYINSLSSMSESFAYPAVLIEADMCAAMEPVEMEGVKDRLFSLSGGSIRPLRRRARPFR